MTVSLSTVDTFSQGTGGSTIGPTITRSSLDFGSYDGSRVIVVAFSWGSSVARSISSVTIGGVAGTLIQSTAGGGASTAAAAMYYALPTGTTGQSVSVQFSGGVGAYSQAIYRVGGVITTPYSSNQVATTGTTVTTSITVGNTGALIESGRSQSNNSISISYDGTDSLTDQLNGLLNGSKYMQSSGLTTEGASRNVGYTGGPSSNSKHIVAATWKLFQPAYSFGSVIT